MFKKILLPLDLTEKHQPAIDTAAELAQHSGGAVFLIHVVEPIPGIPAAEEAEFFRRLERTADERLSSVRDYLSGKTIPSQQKIVIASRAKGVAAYAEEIGADLIIVSAPQFDPEQPTAGWASLSWKVGFLASCPVLLVK